ncbi:hypothetical protein NHX12_012686 [Muraenolepis orangiensis]|uniref:Uncharacterized protein n=1 Tax=Muraenolepis orangiensis TaxID=630683 RepID=A0A9Q0I7C3_9TELE|nr:hypothetical protein NHX12_012686 [Muraenolepis orangiensis]
MILNNRNEELNLRFQVKVEDLDYMLFSDYKLLSNRLREVMDQVVHRDQAYCVPGRWTKAGTSDPLYWLLEEPLVHGARMDICSSNTPGPMAALCGTRTVRFGQPVDAAGVGLTNTQAACSILGLRSSRVVRRFLEQVGPEADGGGAWDAEGLW